MGKIMRIKKNSLPLFKKHALLFLFGIFCYYWKAGIGGDFLDALMTFDYI
jgi:hypothetical protein